MKLGIAGRIGLGIMLAGTLAACGGGDAKSPGEKAPVEDSGNRGYAVVDVEGAGTITGRVSLTGKAPSMPDFAIGDAGGCAQAAKNNRFVVGPDGGIASVVVYLEGVKQGKPMPRPPADALTIDQRGCQYTPHVLAAPVGAIVAFLNSDDIAHNVRVQDAASDSMMLNRAQPVRGRRDSMLVSRVGPASVGCDYHPWMNAYVFGVDNPYYAVTGSDGRFVIEDVPPGTYTMKIWLNGIDVTPRTDNQGKLIRYSFGEPLTRQREVQIRGKNDSVDVRFDLGIAELQKI